VVLSRNGYELEQGKNRLEVLIKRRETYIAYLKDRTDAEDWHGVQDAGSDLREIDVEIRMVKLSMEEGPKNLLKG